MNSSLIVKGELDKAQRDLSDANEALAAYWARSLSDADYKIADIHMAAEALMRAISSVARSVERLAELPTAY